MSNAFFIITYVEDSDREQIVLVEMEEGDSTEDYDLVSRKKFTWWNGDYRDTDGNLESNSDELAQSAKEKAEYEAANYARSIARAHNLTFVGQSNTDGILD